MSAPHEPFAGSGAASEARDREPQPDLRTWARDLALGARFAVSGREGWTRTALTAVGVAMGVALLLLAAAVPAMLHTRDRKETDRTPSVTATLQHPTPGSLLVADANTEYHGRDITGVLLRPEGPAPERPPGVEQLPGPGRMVVSPALRKLLAASPLLRERIPYRITGTIGPAGLLGPAELYFYAGDSRLTAGDADNGGNADRATGFGRGSSPEVLGPVFDLLLVMVLVVLLLPVAIFVGTAVRLGGERRDRRLAALRLVGADIRTTRRIAAGEALLGALLGLALGSLFFLIGRHLAPHVTIRDISAYPSDLRPGTGLAALITVAVPAASVAVTLLSLRGTVVEPLGVVRQGVGRPRRLWWRLLLPAVGLALLAPLFGKAQGTGHINQYQVAAGAVLMLFGVTAVLPWIVEAVVGRLRGGPVAWQLATRRLQLSSNAAARMVSGVTVAVAGAIALQMLFQSVNGEFVTSTGADVSRAQVHVSTRITDGAQTAADVRRLKATRGAAEVFGYTQSEATQGGASKLKDTADAAYLPVVVGDCATLRQLARITRCTPTSTFVVPPPGDFGDDLARYARPGMRIDLNPPEGSGYTGTPRLWTVPAGTPTVAGRTDPAGDKEWGIFAAPQALDAARLHAPNAQIMVALAPKQPDAIEYVRNTAAGFGIGTYVYELSNTHAKSQYTQLRRGLFAGATLTMALIGASLLVTMLEQLRERRKLLAVLVAFGTKRSALAWSVLWQTAVPVVLGLLLAVGGGTALGAALLAMVGHPFRTDWPEVGLLSLVGAGVVFAVTLVSLPPLWRMMRPDGLRTE